ncbi:MAG TPA: hypothetical protein VGM29_13330 [Polyangiaceae bacterium]
MNFFGHAVLAARTSPSDAFVLGAMLPDFASMLGARLPRTSHAELAAGVRFHHRTDDAFHGAPSFLAISREALRFLLERGVRKGSARAVAHVGVELELDRALSGDLHARARYRAALACIDDVAAEITWNDPTTTPRLVALCHSLFARGILREEPAPELMAERLRRILEGRPRLRLDDAGQSVVREWIVAARPSIVSRAPTLVRELEQRLVT